MSSSVTSSGETPAAAEAFIYKYTHVSGECSPELSKYHLVVNLTLGVVLQRIDF